MPFTQFQWFITYNFNRMLHRAKLALPVASTILLLVTGCATQPHKKPEEPLLKTKIDFEQILWYAKRANAAYQTEAYIKQTFPQVIQVATLPNIDVQYFVEVYPEKQLQVISIRGTANFKNIKEDAEYIPIKNPKLGIYVHRGFDDDATKLYTDLIPYLDKNYKVRITGHSLGAAIATLIMMYLHADGFHIDKAINFGQPKVTNKKGAATYNFLPLLRVADENDVVPLVPPITLLDSIHGIYEHLGREVILLDSQYYVYLEEHNAERKSVGSFWKNIEHESIEEHFMKNYLKNISSKLRDAVQVPYAQREKYIGTAK